MVTIRKKRHVLLHVDYGNKRANFYYEVLADYSSEKTNWCNATIGGYSWFYSRANGYPSYYFVHKKHAMFFKLKWSGNVQT